jgi:acetoin utilization deacetylase AcuC-like enzyme
LNYKPKYLVVSLGVDTFNGDILGGFTIETDDNQLIGNAIGSLAKELGCINVMEGDTSWSLLPRM